MAFKSEFAEILAEKLSHPPEVTEKIPRKKVNFPPFPQRKFQPSMEVRTFSPSQIPPSYPVSEKKTRPKKVQVTMTNSTKEVFYKIGELGLELVSDLTILQTLGAEIDPSRISLSGLKKEYRKLAKKYHPDHASAPESGKVFQSACHSYKALEEALVKMGKKPLNQ